MKQTAKSIFSLLLAFSVLSALFCGSPVTAEAADGISVTLRGVNTTSVTVKWSDSKKCTKYSVFRKEKGASGFTKIADTTSKSYQDKGLKKGKIYIYRVKGTYQSGQSKKTVVSADRSIVPMHSPSPSATLSSDTNHVTVQWSYPANSYEQATGFYIYRKCGSGSYERVGTIKKAGYFYKYDGKYVFQYIDNVPNKAKKTYTYKVTAYKTVNSQKYCSSDGTKTASVTTVLKTALTTYGTSIQVKWAKDTSLSGYKIRYVNLTTGHIYGVKKIKDPSVSGYTLSNLNTSKYIYSVQVTGYKIKNGKEVDAVSSDIHYSDDAYALLRAGRSSNAKSSVKVINTRSSKATTAWTESITDSDKKIFRAFANTYFSSCMTKEEKAEYVWWWIHMNVDYDYDYSVSSSKSYTSAIFNYKKGQCLQYNASLVKYMAYLGYDTRIIQGYRGYSVPSNVSHYWGEVQINGKYYCLETGNYGKNGDWSYFVTPYSQAGGYIKCGRVVTS